MCITLVPGPPQFRLLIIGTLAIPNLFVCVCMFMYCMCSITHVIVLITDFNGEEGEPVDK